MVFKKLSGFLATLMLLATFSTTTFAATAEDGTIPSHGPNLTNAQKSEMKVKYDEMNEKWSTLTDAQQKKIYKLMDKQIDIKIQTIDQYLSLGMIDKETATEMKTKLNEKKTKMRESNVFPMFDRGRH